MKSIDTFFSFGWFICILDEIKLLEEPAWMNMLACESAESVPTKDGDLNETEGKKTKEEIEVKSEDSVEDKCGCAIEEDISDNYEL